MGIRHGEEVGATGPQRSVGADRQAPRAEREIGASRLAAEDERADVLLEQPGERSLKPSPDDRFLCVLRMNAGVGEGVGPSSTSRTNGRISARG